MTRLKQRFGLNALAVLGAACFSLPVLAAETKVDPITIDDSFFQWHTTNVQLLRGHDYKVGSKRRTIMTVEHANGFKYGDFYMFYDQTWPESAKANYYIEPTLRFSLGKMTGTDFSYGLIKDVLISTQLEKPEGQRPRYLYGAAVDLNLPGFKFFKTNYFIRDNRNLSGNTYQVTLAWNRPFEIGGVKFLSEGFTDIAGSEGTTTSHQLFVPRFLMDVGDLADIGENKLWVGMEWQYWHNKFGIDGVTESVPQLQVKWVF